MKMLIGQILMGALAFACCGLLGIVIQMARDPSNPAGLWVVTRWSIVGGAACVALASVLGFVALVIR